jgi:hypothetical protein
VGFASLNFSIPVNPALVGFGFNAQGFILDPGAPAGVAMTAGAEITIG